MYSKKGTIRNNLGTFNFRNKVQTTTKNTLVEYSRPYDFVKESKTQASYFPINSVLQLFTNLFA